MAVSICVFAWGKTLLLKGLIWKTNRILALLLLTFSWGCEGPKTGDFYAKPNHSAEAEPPAVSINAPSSENLGSWVSFISTIKEPDQQKTAPNYRYFWDFGDGSQSILANPSHAFAATGTYVVSLTVKDPKGGKGQASTSLKIAGPALGTTWYVATTGSDHAEGSASSPWKTLQHAANLVHPGDTVIVREGKYAGFVVGWDNPKGGSSKAPIIFKADPKVFITSKDNKTFDGIDLESGSNYWVLEGFNINNTDGSIKRTGIRIARSANVIVRKNHVDNCGTWGIFTSHAENVLIEKNECSNSRKEHGIYVSNSADNPVVQGNVCWGNRQCGIHINGDKSQGEDGIISNALVSGNKIHDNGEGGGSGINCDGVQNAWIENNLLYNNHANGISLYRIDGGGPSIHNTVVNNTIVSASNSRWAINIKNQSTDNQLYNNIILNNNKNRGSINIASDSLEGFWSDYNIVTNKLNPADGDVPDLSLARWRSATGQDKHSIVAPASGLFIDPSANDYRLPSTSPAVDTGIAAFAALKDLEGKARPRGAGIDIGAYEY